MAQCRKLGAGLLGALCLFWAGTAAGQDLPMDLIGNGTVSGQGVLLFLLIAAIGVAPALLIVVTCFPFIATVLSILRHAIGLQQSPPNMLIVSLALFLTYFVMEPVFSEAWRVGLGPAVQGTLPFEDAFLRTLEPFRIFMTARVDPETYQHLAELRAEDTLAPSPTSPLSLLVPSFLLSEMTRAFEVGFMIFLPFLIIDLVVAAILMSMGMMMVPPAIVSLPFKLAFFVVADGWTLVSAALVRGYM
ncbi:MULTISPECIES: flagellar type III secretion system pore protein FliP [unclassified Meridianimarinicoccus]|uniref:flagellar type III secretion system pore protein FliP n=1 Tax=unclassified Meridianimarinicoccus TaxID=2923344 RepID=UPI00186614FD|nr:flagellar type III secretion system pore protein FliP [Fluviibacterium sp. MJW13]